MKNLNQYITEKFKISKNTLISKENIIDEIEEIITNTLKEKFDIENTNKIKGFRLYRCNDSGKMVNDINEVTELTLYLVIGKNNLDLNKKISKELSPKLKDYIRDIYVDESTIVSDSYKVKIFLK